MKKAEQRITVRVRRLPQGAAIRSPETAENAPSAIPAGTAVIIIVGAIVLGDATV